MKKTTLLMALLLVFSAFCGKSLADGEMYSIYDCGTKMKNDFDGNDAKETLQLETSLDEYGDGSFTIYVDDAAFTVDNVVGLESSVYAMACPYGTLFMIYEMGPSDDPLTYCLLYSDGALTDAGTIPGAVSTFSVSPYGVITAQVRADTLGTWYREGDFMLATGYSCDYTSENYDMTWYYYICEIPRDIYPMGMVVTLEAELPVYASRFDATPSLTITGGQQVILAASDDVCWLYVTTADSSVGGWVRMANVDGLDYIVINGQNTAADEVFADIIYAD